MSNADPITIVKEIVTKTLADDFDDIKILKIEVAADVDFEGDDVLRIDVVFEGKPKDFNASKLSGVVRRVRPRLFDAGQEAFPMFSFMSENDAEKTLATA